MSEPANSIPVRRRDLPRMFLVVVVGLCLRGPSTSQAEEPLGFGMGVVRPAEGVLGRLAAGEIIHSDEELELQGGSCVLLGDFPQGSYSLDLQCQVRGSRSLDLVVYPRCQPRPSGWGVDGPPMYFPMAFPNVRSRHGSARRDDSESLWQSIRLVVDGATATLFAGGRTLSRMELTGSERGWVAIGARGCGASIAVAQAELTETGFHPLFDGTSLTGWEGADSSADRCWKAEQECIVCTGSEGPWLRSQRTWTNFELRLEYRILPGGNSGVFVRVPADGNHHGPGSGIEVQILDDASPRYRDLKPYQFSGSLYAIEPAEPGSTLPAGQWNTLGIRCMGRHYQVTHNGRLVVDRTEQQCPELVQRLTTGYFGLQNHSEQVWFRHLRVLEHP